MYIEACFFYPLALMYIHSTAGEASRVNAASLWLISVAKAYLQGFLGHEKSLQDIPHSGQNSTTVIWTPSSPDKPKEL